ncbi:transcriptional regulator, LysR family (plasmid) [Xanthobacter versatilis]|uniref:Transcriptional regulator, LysR family n=1 Tax=Xanthobacter autotrophicus (strain ATCC BAA-1158 / Py2) TaxID=78245 RepID=A7IPY9_XANP2|nr:transcriptional regulator, LysR family [Xanthobacter autotrophicus Py2]
MEPRDRARSAPTRDGAGTACVPRANGTRRPAPSPYKDIGGMDFKRLGYFLAVAEELNFGRAAARLKIAQPPLSRQIAQLEQDIGADLFDRSRSQIRLTQAGELMLERAREILALAERTEQEVRRVGEGRAGRLRIAFEGTATYGVLPKIIQAFRAAHPDVELALCTMSHAELKRALIQREIDIAVARPKLDDAELKSEIIAQEDLILAVPDRGEDCVFRLRDLRAETFVLYPRQPRPGFCDLVLDVCRQEGFTPGEQVFTQDYQTAITLVSIGTGISLVPASVSESSRAGVLFARYEGFNPGTELSLNYRRDNQMPHLFNFVALSRKIAKGGRAA